MGNPGASFQSAKRPRTPAWLAGASFRLVGLGRELSRVAASDRVSALFQPSAFLPSTTRWMVE
jgi:hypothetical protein